MKNIGSILALAGIISIALYFFGYELKILGWIENWGETVAWVIRGGLVVVGGALWFLGPDAEKAESEA